MSSLNSHPYLIKYSSNLTPCPHHYLSIQGLHCSNVPIQDFEFDTTPLLSYRFPLDINGGRDGGYDHFQRPVMINRTIQDTNQGAPTKSNAPRIIIKTLVSLVEIQEIAATIGMIPMISTQPKNPNAESNSQTAAGTGTAANPYSTVLYRSIGTHSRSSSCRLIRETPFSL